MRINRTALVIALLLNLALLIIIQPWHEIGQLHRIHRQGHLLPWQTTVDIHSNAYYSWRIEPITSLFDNRDRLSLTTYATALSLLLIALGIALSRKFSSVPWFESTLIASIVVTWILLLFGRDAVLLQAIAWAPLGYALLQFHRSKRNRWLSCALILFGSIELALSANQLAMLVAAAVLIWAGSETIATIPSWLRVVAGIVLLSPLLFAPAPPLAGYPAFSHVVPDDGVLGIVRPWYGPDPLIPLIDRQALRRDFSSLSLILFFVSLLLLFLEKRTTTKRFTIIVLIVSSGLLVDNIFPESLSQIGFLQALSRSVPGLFLFSLTPLAAALCLLSFALINSASTIPVSIVSATFAILYSLFVVRPTTLLYRTSAQMPYREYLSYQPQLENEQRRAMEEWLVSPSYSVLTRVGFWVLAEEDRVSHTQFTAHLPSLTQTLDSTGREATAAIDGKLATRWSLARGQQQGDEALSIMLPKPISLSAIALATGKFSSDFPRGIRVLGLPECSSVHNISMTEANIELLVEQPSWQGGLEYTATGFPYFEGQDQVQLYFQRLQKIQCLTIQQTEHEPHFDWSVAEISLGLSSSEDMVALEAKQ